MMQRWPLSQVSRVAVAVDVRLSETDAATGDESTRTGKVWYQLDENGSARIRVTFDRKESGGKVAEDRIEYVLSGPDLVDRNYRGKTQVTRRGERTGNDARTGQCGICRRPCDRGNRFRRGLASGF